jgi:hypothetical protein
MDIGMDLDVDIGYQNSSDIGMTVFSPDIFSSDIEITDVDVGYRRQH